MKWILDFLVVNIMAFISTFNNIKLLYGYFANLKKEISEGSY